MHCARTGAAVLYRRNELCPIARCKSQSASLEALHPSGGKWVWGAVRAPARGALVSDEHWREGTRKGMPVLIPKPFLYEGTRKGMPVLVRILRLLYWLQEVERVATWGFDGEGATERHIGNWVCYLNVPFS